MNLATIIYSLGKEQKQFMESFLQYSVMFYPHLLLNLFIGGGCHLESRSSDTCPT